MHARMFVLLVSVFLIQNILMGQNTETASFVRVKSGDVPISNILPRNQIILLQGDTKCRKCEASVAAFVEKYKSNKGESGIIRVQLVNRLIDSMAYKTDMQVDCSIYIDRARISGWDSRAYENKWVYYDTTTSEVVFMSLDCTEEINKLERRGGLDRLKRMRISEQPLPSLQERQALLAKPVFNLYVRDSVIVVGSGNELRLDLYNITSGERISKVTFQDTLFSAALEDGEWFENENPFDRPEILAAELNEEGEIVLVGRILAGEHAGEGRVAVNDRYFIAKYDTLSKNIVWQKKPNEISAKLKSVAMRNTTIAYPYIFVSNCPWGLEPSEIYKEKCARIVNIESGETEEYAVCDSAYRILDIGKNYLSGYTCVINGEVYTAQPLSPRIVNENTGEDIYLDDDNYNNYYGYLEKEGDRISKLSNKLYERASQYDMKVLVRGIYKLTDEYMVVALMKKTAKGFQNGLEVYEVGTGKKIDEVDIEPGWTIQRGDCEIIHIYIEKDEYRVSSFKMINEAMPDTNSK